MLVEIPAGEVVNLTTAISVPETSEYGIESNFERSARNTPIYLVLAASAPATTSEYDTVILPDQDSIHSFKTVQGVSGSSLFAYRDNDASGDTMSLRVTSA